MSSIMHDMR